jgi:hypothetical protein
MKSTANNPAIQPDPKGIKTKNHASMKHRIILTLGCLLALPSLGQTNTWNVDGNFVSPGQFLGSTNFQSVELKAGGMRVLRLEPDSRTNVGGLSGNLIGGFINNAIEQPGSGGDFIGGGGFPAGPNIIHSGSSGVFIGAGSANQIGPNVNDAVIVGGFGNQNVGFDSSVGGGRNNSILFASDHCVIAGGQSNSITGSELLSVFNTIGGGFANATQTNATLSVIGGGGFNVIGASAADSTIAGGLGNTIASGANVATVGGGQANTSAGHAATVPGGFQNSALGNFSFAAGAMARANFDNTFVWAGGASNVYPSLKTGTFNVYASGGAMFEYGGQEARGRGNRFFYVGPLSAGTTVTAWNGARLTDGGVWANASDKNRKTDFQEVDPLKILDRVAALPVREWRYTNEVASVKHLGPTAQDFQNAFGLGSDDISIGTVDADGVALAAIQGLNRKVEEKERRIRELETSVNELKQLCRALAEGKQ